MKLFNVRKAMVLVSFPFTKRGYHAHRPLEGENLKKKMVILENIKPNELSLIL